jgi:hypothetical protein
MPYFRIQDLTLVIGHCFNSQSLHVCGDLAGFNLNSTTSRRDYTRPRSHKGAVCSGV